MAKRRNPYRNDPLSEGEMDRRGLTEQPLLRNRDGFRFVKYAGWAVGIFLCGWAMMYCGVYVDSTPDNQPIFQDGELNDDYVPTQRSKPRSYPKGQERPEPTSPDAGAYDWDD